MPLDIIGAGFFRTGTTSFREAMSILGFGPCYHMKDNLINGDCDHWIAIAENGDPSLIKTLIEKKDYRSSTDIPSMLFWREQLIAYPGAKTILTVRDSDKWFNSSSSTVFYMNPSFEQCPLGVRVAVGCGLITKNLSCFYRKVYSQAFKHGISCKRSILDSFHDHNESVKREILPENLLVFDVSEGWEPLCRFLNRPIPDVSFPNLNDTDQFQEMVKYWNTVGYIFSIVGLGIPLIFRAKMCETDKYKRFDYFSRPIGINYNLFIGFFSTLGLAIPLLASFYRLANRKVLNIL